MTARPYAVEVLTPRGWRCRGTYTTRERAARRARQLDALPLSTPRPVRVIDRRFCTHCTALAAEGIDCATTN